MKLVERVDAVPLATAELLLQQGARKVRTAAIAERAGITESTLFRKYGNLEKVWAATDAWCWREVTKRVARASFESPQMDARRILLQDTAAIWEMRDDPDLRVAATCALLFMRRKQAFDLTENSKAQIEFERRIDTLCQRIAVDDGLAPECGSTVAQLILNYMASVWLTWATMHFGSDDITTAHDLTADEAQMGIAVLVSHEYFRRGTTTSTGADGTT